MSVYQFDTRFDFSKIFNNGQVISGFQAPLSVSAKKSSFDNLLYKLLFQFQPVLLAEAIFSKKGRFL